jgi:hypothetical protein
MVFKEKKHILFSDGLADVDCCRLTTHLNIPCPERPN